MSVLRTDRDRFLDGVGVAPAHLEEGVRVMVPVGTGSGSTSVVALAVCRGPADREGVWWFDVYVASATTPLPQMYPVDQLLGIPALGLRQLGLDVDEAEPNTS